MRKILRAGLTAALVIGLLSSVISCTETTSVTPTPTPASTPTAVLQGETIVVSSTADSGPGTLRQALREARTGDVITFDPSVFPPNAPATIFPSSQLPLIEQGNLIIDASNAGVILDGSSIQKTSANGLTITSEGNTIRGLQIVHFPGAGIDLHGNARNNTIGGDRNTGVGPVGQGNLVSGNKAQGIGIWYDASYNTILGNYVGTDVSGTTARGNSNGIHINGGSYNRVINNLLSGNTGYGIELCCTTNTHDNTINGNYIGTDVGGENALGNQTAGIAVHNGASHNIIGPDNVFADIRWGIFWEDLSSLRNIIIRKLVTLQEGNSLSKTGIETKPPKELLDNHIIIGGGATDWAMRNASDVIREVTSFGAKQVTWTFNEGEEYSIFLYEGTVGIDWSESEFDISPDPGGPDDYVAGLTSNGIAGNYMLTFWDKANHPEGWNMQPGFSRFSTEEDIQLYLDYVRFIVSHFKGRIQYYELWGEPEMGGLLQQIKVEDYINLVKRTVPIIREEDPEAKVVIGGLVIQEPRSRDYLFTIVKSDIMPLVDVVSWHPMFSVSPEYLEEYYYEYPSIVQEIKDVASAHGFKGEYRGDSTEWSSTDCADYYPGDVLYSNVIAAKYYSRGIVMHLGMGLTAGVAGASSTRMTTFVTLRNLCTIMAGAKPISLFVDIQSNATDIRNYNFSLPDGSHLVALWTDGVAIDEDPGVKAEVTLLDVSAQNVMGIDVLNSFEQPLNFNVEGSNLVINDLLIRDYPIFIRLIP